MNRTSRFRWVAAVCVSAAVLLLIVAVALAQNAATASNRAKEEGDIFETVIRHEMDSWMTGGQKAEAEAKTEIEKRIAKELNFAIFFIAVRGKDPSDDFLRRFQDVPRVIKKASESTINKQYRLAVIDKESGRRGIIFWISGIKWNSDDSVEVEGGYHCDGLCAAGIVFVLQRKEKKWRVMKETLQWIS